APQRTVGRERRRRRTALLSPPVLERDVLAERADVDEVLAVGGEPGCSLPHQQRAFANRTAASHRLPRDPHRRDYSEAVALEKPKRRPPPSPAWPRRSPFARCARVLPRDARTTLALG